MITEKKYGPEFELEIHDGGWCCQSWHWELISNHIYICSYDQTEGYATKASAKRAALRVAKQLGLSLKEASPPAAG
jgi:hypothetical protein